MIADKRLDRKKVLQPRPEQAAPSETTDTGFFVANGIPEADLIAKPTLEVPIQPRPETTTTSPNLRLKRKNVRQISASQNEEPTDVLLVPIDPQSTDIPEENDDGLKVEELLDDMPLDSSMSVKVEFIDEANNEETHVAPLPVEVAPEKEVRSNTTNLIEIRPSTMQTSDAMTRLREENRQLKFANLHLQVILFYHFDI